MTSPLTGLVLTGGGARAAYQVGVLTWLAENRPGTRIPLVAGVSAGAANAMGVASLGVLPEAVARLREGWRRPAPRAGGSAPLARRLPCSDCGYCAREERSAS